MFAISDKRARVAQFQARLRQALEMAGTSRAALAREVGIDRSTVTQMLAGDGVRMPGGHVVAGCAQVLGVSADWLLGLSDRSEPAGALLDSSMSISETGRATGLDDRIVDWHREAEGYKIRHVPAALPDMLKTDAVLRWEFAPLTHRRPAAAIEAAAERIEGLRASESDYEMAMPVHELESLARGEGYYAGLEPTVRAEQIDWIGGIYGEVFPKLRLMLYDARQVYSSPVTVFGPMLAVIYMGRHFIAFRDRDRVRSVTQHFDWLVREAVISDREVSGYLDGLRASVR